MSEATSSHRPTPICTRRGFEYDGVGRRVATELPLGQRSSTEYDSVGNVSSTTDFNGETITYDYDLNNRLTDRQFPDGTSVTFTYTPTGQRETVTDGRGVTTYEYDERDRLLARTDPDSTRIEYTYDLVGNRTSLTIPSGTTQYTYDVLNRLETVVDPDLDTTTYQYDAAGNLIRTDFANGTTETRAYDDLNRLTFIGTTGPAGVIASFTYELSPDGNRQAVTEQAGRRVEYTYDELSRLTQERILEGGVETRLVDYTHDDVGNRLTRTDSAEGLTEYVLRRQRPAPERNDRRSRHDLRVRRERQTRWRRPPAVSGVTYDWNVEGRLIAADTDGDGTNDVTYEYDADGIRVTQILEPDAAAIITRYLIDGNRRFAQLWRSTRLAV